MDGGAIVSQHPEGAPGRITPFLLSILAFTVSFSSFMAWKVSDVDFANKVGSESLAEAYVLIAVVLLVGSWFMLSRLKRRSAQSIFMSFQRYAVLGFGALSLLEVFFSLSHYAPVLFLLKVIGYAHSVFVCNTFWITVGPYNPCTRVSGGQYTTYCLCAYLGMATAGICLQSEALGAAQFGALATFCSLVCWGLGQLTYNGPRERSTTKSRVEAFTAQFSSRSFIRSMSRSTSVMVLVLCSVLLNVLVSSTEYYFICDFECRYLSLTTVPHAVQSVGSFITLIGLGNVLALFTPRLCDRFCIGRASIPLATLLVLAMIKVGFTESQSIFSSILTLLVVESLYPMVVESNMQYLLKFFPEAEQLSARSMIDAIAEPGGFILGAVLLFTPWFDILALGIAVVGTAIFLVVYSYLIGRSTDGPASQMRAGPEPRDTTIASSRPSGPLALARYLCHTFWRGQTVLRVPLLTVLSLSDGQKLPGLSDSQPPWQSGRTEIRRNTIRTYGHTAELLHDLPEHLGAVEGFDWFSISAVQWGE